MIAITKAEKEAISERFPHVHIVRTMKQKSKRHRYYCEESRAVLRFLEKLNGGSDSANTSREGVGYTGGKKTKRV